MGKASGVNKTKRRGKAAFWRWAALGAIWATFSTCFYVQALEPSDGAASKREQASAYLGEAFEAYNAKDYATALAKCGASLALEETKAAQNLMQMCKTALEKSSTSSTKQASKSAVDEWTKSYSAGTLKSVKVDGITYNFRYCPNGTFTMGSPEDEEGRGGREGEARGEVLEPQHRVTLTKFWMLETEVTVGMWRAFVKATNYRQGSGRMGMGMYGVTEDGTMLLDSKYTWENPGYSQTERHPVVGVDWPGAVAFCEWLAKETGLPVRLPTEAEWEYACRAGTTTAYSFGSNAKYITQYANVHDSKTLSPSGYDALALAKAKRLNLASDGYRGPAPVRRFKPNDWNLYDMHGNVTEWCYDLFEMYDSDEQVDPVGALGPKEGLRVLRGGAWNKLPMDCRSAMRFYGLPENKSVSNGFRVVIGRKIKASDADAVAPAAPVAVAPASSGDWTKAHPAGTAKALEIKGATYNFRYCPPGTFQMGSPESEEGRGYDDTQHRVTLTRGFWMLETEVTQALWESVMNANPVSGSDWQGPKKPVVNVSWEECQKFIDTLNSLGIAPAGLKFRFPTEAEWEYACRAGTSGAYAGSSLDSMGWHRENSGGHIHDVGEKEPNDWGLRDMHGNVCEWCSDWFDFDTYDAASQTDPKGPPKGSARVLRGGGWYLNALRCRSAHRGNDDPTNGQYGYGFRIALGRALPGAASGSALDAERPQNPAPVAPAPVAPTAKAAGDWTGKHAAGTLKSLEIAGATYNFRYCPPGTFQMGSPATEVGREARETQRRVTLTEGFWILETEATVGMWRSFVKATNYKMGSDFGYGYDLTTGIYGPNLSYTWENPGVEQTDERPVTQVDWNGAVAFCEWLAKETGLPVRLPTEAEWEYACRAGTTTAYFFGNAPEDLTEYGNFADKSAKTKFPHWGWATSNDDGYAFTAPVKSFKPNAWGLYDMHGNVWEWCLDYYAEDSGATSLVDPTGPTAGARRVLRGGSWTGSPRRCRAAYSASEAPTRRNGGNGFRVVIGGVKAAPVAPLAETCEPIAVPVPAPAPGAFQWLERAAKAGNVDALRAIFLFYDGENPEIAGAALEKFATLPDCEDPYAKLALAVAYAYGYGVEQDAEKAFALFKELEEEHQPNGPLHEALLLALALCYDRGFGVAEDVSKTIELYEKGLALNYPTATANYGWCCGVGRGVPKNPTEMLRYYRRASDMGETGASCNLGSCCENGAYGLPRDAKQAFELYKKAADAGAPRGMLEVARCYENGVGVERSVAEAEKWRKRAENAPAFFIEPIPGAENLAPPQGLRLNGVGLFVGRRVPQPPIVVSDLPADFPVLRESVDAPATR